MKGKGWRGDGIGMPQIVEVSGPRRELRSAAVLVFEGVVDALDADVADDIGEGAGVVGKLVYNLRRRVGVVRIDEATGGEQRRRLNNGIIDGSTMAVAISGRLIRQVIRRHPLMRPALSRTSHDGEHAANEGSLTSRDERRRRRRRDGGSRRLTNG